MMLLDRRRLTPWILSPLVSSPFDEYLKFCHEHIAAKTATMNPHPIIDRGNVDKCKTFIKAAVSCRDEGTFATPAFSPSSLEDVELYWYLLEIFTDHDLDKDGIIKMSEFPTMMNEFLTVQKKLNLPVPPEGQYDVLFKKYDSRNDGRPSADEWMSLASQEVCKMF